MRRVIPLIAVFILAFSSLYAKGEVFFSNIVNASYLTDFAMGAFPISFWGEFGIDHIDLFPNLNSKVVVRVEAGMAQRTLRQYPETGELITDHNPGADENYSVVFSYGTVGFEQGIVDGGEGKSDFLTASVSLGMRWEQAFASLAHIQQGNMNGVFGSDYFNGGERKDYPGTPELSGNLYSLATSLNFGLSFRNLDDHYIHPDGYNFSISGTIAPWWLFNDRFSIVNAGTRIDYYRLLYNATWKYTAYELRKGDFNLFSVVMDFRLNCQFLFGSDVPRYAYSVRFRGNEIPPRSFITDVNVSLILNGPEFFTVGTYPQLYVFVENAVSAGRVLNSLDATESVKMYGAIGTRLQLNILGVFRAYIGFYYDYLPMEGYDGGFDLDFGAYFSAFF